MRLLRRLEKNHDGIRSATTRQNYIQIYQEIQYLPLAIAEFIAQGPHMTGPPRVYKVGHTRYFWDTNVLMVAEIWSQLRAEAKQHLGLRDALFGVVHGLAPHPDALVLQRVEDGAVS
jgi:hypothetical protein